MGDIVNLKAVRKSLARAERADEAQVNRIKFGRTKAEKDQARLETARAEKALTGHKIDE